MMNSLSFADMDERKAKRMSSAVWLSDDIKQQLFLFHEDLPQQDNGTPARVNSKYLTISRRERESQ
jgi:hypothetical protein